MRSCNRGWIPSDPHQQWPFEWCSEIGRRIWFRPVISCSIAWKSLDPVSPWGIIPRTTTGLWLRVGGMPLGLYASENENLNPKKKWRRIHQWNDWNGWWLPYCCVQPLSHFNFRFWASCWLHPDVSRSSLHFFEKGHSPKFRFCWCYSSCFIMFHCCHMIHVRCSISFLSLLQPTTNVTNAWVISICLTSLALPDGPRNSFYSWPPTLLFAPAPLQSSNEPVPVPKGRNVERLKSFHIHSNDCWESWYFSCFSDFQSNVNFENKVLGCIYSLWTKNTSNQTVQSASHGHADRGCCCCSVASISFTQPQFVVGKSPGCSNKSMLWWVESNLLGAPRFSSRLWSNRSGPWAYATHWGGNGKSLEFSQEIAGLIGVSQISGLNGC